MGGDGDGCMFWYLFGLTGCAAALVLDGFCFFILVGCAVFWQRLLRTNLSSERNNLAEMAVGLAAADIGWYSAASRYCFCLCLSQWDTAVCQCCLCRDFAIDLYRCAYCFRKEETPCIRSTGCCWDCCRFC